MPELPEVEATRRRIARAIVGKRILAVHSAGLARIITGRTIRSVGRRGKNLLIGLSGGYTIRVHLGMTGELFTAPGFGGTPYVRAWFELSGGLALVFRDPRKLGRIVAGTDAAIARQLAKLGPEPLSAEFTPETLLTAAARSRQPAKPFLMDQSRVAGLGNIYAAEALFRAGIDPRRPISKVSPERLRRLHAAIRAVLREATGFATIAYKRPGEFGEGERGRRVYAREGEPCTACGAKVRRIGQAGRSTYYCPNCQR